MRAPWGNVCVTYGTHYVPIALPSILGSLVLFLPLIWALREVRARDKEIFALRERLRKRLTRRNNRRLDGRRRGEYKR